MGSSVIFQLQELDKAASALLPEQCRTCGWWQGQDDDWREPAQADSWAETALETFGGWGKLAIGDDDLLGMIQYGPSELFARAGDFACGPVSEDAVLLTCSLVSDRAYESVRKSLLTAALAEFREREVETIEAFCCQDENPENECRFFDYDFLSDCGFYPVRSSRGLQLMRCELGGALPAKIRKQKSHRRILERIKRASASPAPAAMCESKESCAGRVPVCP
jgi:hypothetical protein